MAELEARFAAAVLTVERSTFKDCCSNDLAERPAGRPRLRVCVLFQLYWTLIVQYHLFWQSSGAKSQKCQ